jgi:hypothetical protein
MLLTHEDCANTFGSDGSGALMRRDDLDAPEGWKDYSE